MTKPIQRALVSVSDKSGIVEFCTELVRHKVEILSTGGTARALGDAGVDVREVADVTGFPEILDGRVKTLHPGIHGGLLAERDNEDHLRALLKHGIGEIDLLVVNLYPFERTLAAGGDFGQCVENIDIGGPAMIRAAAKNHAGVTVVADPGDYDDVLGEMRANAGSVTPQTRRRLAARAFARTAAYDAAISGWMSEAAGESTPRWKTLGGTLIETLRYGENPHQKAAVYRSGDDRPGVVNARQLQGRALSYNNINDTDAAYECIGEFNARDLAACVIVKHANPCGVALAHTLQEAYGRALACDPVSAFGGIIALNRVLTGETAIEMIKLFVEVIIAPGFDDDALAILAQKPNVRVLSADALPSPNAKGFAIKTVAGGFLLQSRDDGQVMEQDLQVVTRRRPDERELADMLFAFMVAKHVKSNAIVYARDNATVGIGAGQMSRIDSSRIAARKAADTARAAGLDHALTAGSVAASDAFFPFADGLLQVADAGATAVIQPGGSVRDDEVIAAADEAGLAMVFTGLRHFRH